jgi:hypothetical protein
MKRFRKITHGLYRGSAPSVSDIRHMHKYLGLNKVVSLDQTAGQRVDHICKQLGIKHVMLPLNGDRKSLIHLLSLDLYKLLIDGGPTFLHCAEGKDRTGFVSAMFKCLYMDYTFEEAMQEAKSLGFGVGVDPAIIQMYVDALKSACQEKEQESIVQNEWSYKSDWDGRGSYLDQAHQGSFAPFISKTRQYPYDNPYNTINDQSPTRENYHDQDMFQEINLGSESDFPVVGGYDNNAGVRGFGPAEPYGGFLHD